MWIRTLFRDRQSLGRLIFIILIFAKGFGLLLYPILWLVIPVANSASDF